MSAEYAGMAFDAHGPARTEGVWCVVERDHGDYISRVYPDEVSALRSAVENGWGRVQFVKWGEGVED